jgi:perosamine synthetase
MMFVPHNRIVAEEADALAVSDVVRSGNWAIGQVTESLEAALARACGRSAAVSVASGLSALRLALLATGVAAHGRVGVPAYSCVALANAVLSIGATPVAIDCDSLSLNIDCTDKAVIADLNAIILVNTFGVSAELGATGATEIPVIEDCSHGFGHGVLGRRGAMAVFSLHATKFLGAGRGGAILADNEVLVGRLRNLREYDDKPASEHALNEKPDDLNAALALSRLRRIDDVIKRRRNLARRYQSGLARIAATGRIRLPIDDESRIWYRYTIQTDDADRWLQALQGRGIGAAIPVTNWLSAEDQEKCPVARAAYRTIVSLPLFPSMTEDEQDAVVSAVNYVAEVRSGA